MIADAPDRKDDTWNWTKNETAYPTSPSQYLTNELLSIHVLLTHDINLYGPQLRFIPFLIERLHQQQTSQISQGYLHHYIYSLPGQCLAIVRSCEMLQPLAETRSR